MKLGRLHGENPLRTVVRSAPRLLDDECQRIRLVQQPELAIRRLGVGRIGEDAAAEEVAVKVGDERADVSSLEWPPAGAEPS